MHCPLPRALVCLTPAWRMCFPLCHALLGAPRHLPSSAWMCFRSLNRLGRPPSFAPRLGPMPCRARQVPRGLHGAESRCGATPCMPCRAMQSAWRRSGIAPQMPDPARRSFFRPRQGRFSPREGAWPPPCKTCMLGVLDLGMNMRGENPHWLGHALVHGLSGSRLAIGAWPGRCSQIAAPWQRKWSRGESRSGRNPMLTAQATNQGDGEADLKQVSYSGFGHWLNAQIGLQKAHPGPRRLQRCRRTRPPAPIYQGGLRRTALSWRSDSRSGRLSSAWFVNSLSYRLLLASSLQICLIAPECGVQTCPPAAFPSPRKR